MCGDVSWVITATAKCLYQCKTQTKSSRAGRKLVELKQKGNSYWAKHGLSFRAKLFCIFSQILSVDRTRDVKDAVRKAAYEVLAEKVKIKSLTIAQRLKLLESGLHDRSVLVKKACTERLLTAWLRDLDNQVPELLKCLHVESSPESSVLTLKALFESKEHIILHS